MYRFRYDPTSGFVPIPMEDSSPAQNVTTTETKTDYMKDDKEWNRTLFPVPKAQILFHVFDMMKGCINKCIFCKFGNVNEMLLNYNYVYDEVHCIIVKNMRATGYPPSVFSAAVHQHVMHNNFNRDPTWRVVSGVFEYTAMEIAAEIEASKAKEIRKAVNANDAAKTIYSWLWNGTGREDSKHPHDMIKETHEKVHATHDKLEELDNKLQKLFNIIQEMQKQT